MAQKINVILFFVLVLGFPLCYFTLPVEQLSKTEKRKLAVIPSFNNKNYLSGLWASRIDDYVDDHFPFRSNLISYSEIFQSSKGFTLEHAEKIVVVPHRKKRAKPDPFEEDKGSMQFLDDFEEKYEGSLLIIDGCVYPMGAGSAKMSKYFAAMVDEYAIALKGKTRVFSAVPPLSSAFIPVEKYRKYNEQNKRTLLAIKYALKEGIFCDVFASLNNHTDKKLYFGSDHHWKPLGAYYGYVAFCKAAGIEPVPLEKMDKKVKYNFLGSMYQHTQDPSVRAHPDTMEYWIPKVATTAERFGRTGTNNPIKAKVFYESSSGGNTYSTFLGGDMPLMKIKTSVKNGKKAIIVKNSMGNAFSVYLISHYEEVWIVDLRYSKQNLMKLIGDNKIDDLIFAVGMYAAMGSGTIKMMRNLGTQSGNYVPEVIQSTPDPVVQPEVIQDTIQGQ